MVLDLAFPGVTHYRAFFRGEAIPGGKTLIEDMPMSLQQDFTYEETKDLLEKVMYKGNVSNATVLTTFANTEKRVENMTRNGVFLTNPELWEM